LDERLGGQADAAVFAACQREGRVLVTILPTYDSIRRGNMRAFGFCDPRRKASRTFSSSSAVAWSCTRASRLRDTFGSSSGVESEFASVVPSAKQAVAADRDTASQRRRERSISLCARVALQTAARGR
jgi:hypothetical protein